MSSILSSNHPIENQVTNSISRFLSFSFSGHPLIPRLRLRQGKRYFCRISIHLRPWQHFSFFQFLHAATHAGAAEMLFQEHVLSLPHRFPRELATLHDTAGREGHRAILEAAAF